MNILDLIVDPPAAQPHDKGKVQHQSAGHYRRGGEPGIKLAHLWQRRRQHQADAECEHAVTGGDDYVN